MCIFVHIDIRVTYVYAFCENVLCIFAYACACICIGASVSILSYLDLYLKVFNDAYSII